MILLYYLIKKMEEKDNNNLLKIIKSKYILKQIADNLELNKLLYLIKYNKYIQNKLDIFLLLIIKCIKK